MARVLITGANRGIGLALAKTYCNSGDDVIATARHPERATELQETGARVVKLEVTDPHSVEALGEALAGQPIDLLINNAGMGDRDGFQSLDFDTFETILAVNTIAPIRILRTLRPNLAAGSAPMVANISSLLGSIEDAGGDMGITYRVSKAGLNMALRAAAPTLAADGITVLALHPGWVKTDMGGEAAPISPTDSARGLKRVIAEAGPSPTLRFLDWQGKTLPW
ncbi:MAG: SDR family oxidoreductase [Pseudomonadota bacterium]